MRTLISADLQQFLNENGYNWTGYIAENTSQATEKYYRCSKWQNDLNDHYIILGKTYDWDEEEGYVCVRDNKHVRYIIQDDTTLKVCNRLSGGRLSLEKDLSDKWVEYQVKTIPGYAENILTQCKSIQANYSRKVQDRKNLLAQDIERLTKEANKSIEAMEQRVNRSKQVEQIIHQSKSDLQV